MKYAKYFSCLGVLQFFLFIPNQATSLKAPDVVFVPTPQSAVNEMLDLARVSKNDTVYDLGSGDGRIVVSAAKRGAKSMGFDIDPQRVKEGRENITSNKVSHLASIQQKDIFTVDLSNASVVTLYLLPELNVRLIPQLQTLKPGSRIVSYDFDMEGVTPDKVIVSPTTQSKIYLWTTPLKKQTSTF